MSEQRPLEPTGDPEPAEDVVEDVDAHRRRRMRQIVLGGSGTGIVVFLLAGLGGADGRDGLAILLLLTAATCAVAAVYGGVTLLVDDLRSVAISGRRILATVGLFALAALLMAMVAGIGG